jgi:hypothetical protein
MIQAISAFLDFCYLVRHSSFTEADLVAIDKAAECFQDKRVIFEETGACPNGISIPCIHAIQHYRRLIQEFGAPNGLCSSITESKHIRAVKDPWRKTNRYQPLLQMLLINQRLDKLAQFHANRYADGLLDTPLVPAGTEVEAMPTQDSDDEDSEAHFRDDSTLDEVEEDDGIRSDAMVQLAKTPSKWKLCFQYK